MPFAKTSSWQNDTKTMSTAAQEQQEASFWPEIGIVLTSNWEGGFAADQRMKVMDLGMDLIGRDVLPSEIDKYEEYGLPNCTPSF